MVKTLTYDFFRGGVTLSFYVGAFTKHQHNTLVAYLFYAFEVGLFIVNGATVNFVVTSDKNDTKRCCD